MLPGKITKTSLMKGKHDKRSLLFTTLIFSLIKKGILRNISIQFHATFQLNTKISDPELVTVFHFFFANSQSLLYFSSKEIP